jgi:hypothetical protein
LMLCADRHTPAPGPKPYAITCTLSMCCRHKTHLRPLQLQLHLPQLGLNHCSSICCCIRPCLCCRQVILGPEHGGTRLVSIQNGLPPLVKHGVDHPLQLICQRAHLMRQHGVCLRPGARCRYCLSCHGRLETGHIRHVLVNPWGLTIVDRASRCAVCTSSVLGPAVGAAARHGGRWRHECTGRYRRHLLDQQGVSTQVVVEVVEHVPHLVGRKQTQQYKQACQVSVCIS